MWIHSGVRSLVGPWPGRPLPKGKAVKTAICAWKLQWMESHGPKAEAEAAEMHASISASRDSSVSPCVLTRHDATRRNPDLRPWEAKLHLDTVARDAASPRCSNGSRSLGRWPEDAALAARLTFKVRFRVRVPPMVELFQQQVHLQQSNSSAIHIRNPTFLFLPEASEP